MPPAPAPADLAATLEARLVAQQAAFEGQIAVLQSQLVRMQADLLRLQNSQTIYLGDHEALTRLHTGHRIYVDTRDVGICSHLMLEGRWEPWIEAVMQAAVKPGMRFADVGANFGYYTLLGAQWVGSTGAVYAFEANPAICRKLRKSVSINGFDGIVRIHEIGVWSTEGSLELGFTHEFSGGGGIGAGDHPVWRLERVTIPVAPLDSLLADVPAIDVMKIDVEGAEPAALTGAQGLLARSPAVTLIVEFQADSVAQHTGAAPAGYLAGFLSQGFALRLIEPGGLTASLTPENAIARLGSQLGYLHLQRG